MSSGLDCPFTDPCHTLPPNVVIYTLSLSNGSGITRWPHLKLNPAIRVQCSPRSIERHADDSNPDAYSKFESRASIITSYTCWSRSKTCLHVRPLSLDK